MTDRPAPVATMLRLAERADNEVQYEITFRAWQLKEISKYIKTLEKERDSE